MKVPAIVAAGEGRASKAVYGESKVYLELGGQPLVRHVVSVLQQVPEISEVWVVGNADRLESVLGGDDYVRTLAKPLHIVPQFRNLYENCWEGFRRTLPGAGPQGRDPGPEDEHRQALFISGDLPFATPHEVSAFIRTALGMESDFVLGLVTEESMRSFYPKAHGEPGIEMACFNLAEGRYRQSNLHLVKPVRLGNRYYIEEMYEHRYQKQFGNIIGLAWKLVRSEQGGLRVAGYFGLLQLASICDRLGWKRMANRLRARVNFEKVESTIGMLLRTEFRLAVTHVGGCAVDIDNEEDYDAAKLRFEEWHTAQLARGEEVCDVLPASTKSEPTGDAS